MEIKIDSTRQADYTPRTQSSGSPQQTKNTTVQAQQESSSPRRDLLNAMALMQTASGIVQEALNASSKLRSIAFSTIATGSTDYAEIAKTISGIQSSLHQYGKPVLAPAIKEDGTEKKELPGIEKELNVMAEMTEKKSVDPELLSSAEKKLTEIKSDIDTRVQSMRKEGGFGEGKIVPSYEMAAAVTGNAAAAHAAQGNISAETVSSLLRPL